MAMRTLGTYRPPPPPRRVVDDRGRSWPDRQLVRGVCEDHTLCPLGPDGPLVWESDLNKPRQPIPNPSGLQGYRDSGTEIIDFRCLNPDPFFITKPYGPAAPWPADRPATWFTKPYGRADLSEPDLRNATLMISPKGAPMMSDRYVLTERSDLALPKNQLDGWWTDQWGDLKRYSTTHPWATVAIWGGIVLLGVRALGVLKG